jgi:hypothetical protein
MWGARGNVSLVPHHVPAWAEPGEGPGYARGCRLPP